jgi:MYXO-CTERM domain-containing protein
VGMLVCASGVCNPISNRCGSGHGDAGADASSSFDSGVPIGVSLEGGALSCTARSGPTSTASAWLLGVGLALASLARRKR